MNSMWRCGLQSVAASLTLAVACSTSFAQAVKIRVGNTITTDVASAALFNAIEKGEFKKEGIDIESRSFIQSTQKYDMMKGGGIDIDVNMGAINAAQMFSVDVPIVVVRAVAPADIWAVVVRSDSKITKPEDFDGKKYGVVSLSGTNFGVTYFALKSAGVNLIRQVKLSTLPPAGLISALERGDVEGATLYEPFLSDALKAGNVKMLFRPGEVYQRHYKEPFFALTISVRKEFYEQNKEAVRKFVAVIDREARAMATDPTPAMQALAKRQPELKMSGDQVKEVLGPYIGNYITSENDPGFVRKVQNFYDRLFEIKQLPRPVKASDFWIKP